MVAPGKADVVAKAWDGTISSAIPRADVGPDAASDTHQGRGHGMACLDMVGMRSRHDDGFTGGISGLCQANLPTLPSREPTRLAGCQTI